ncbi:MAG: VTC domain-containing protein [Kiritimatiellia bacterium]|jgi:hypothetical protein
MPCLRSSTPPLVNERKFVGSGALADFAFALLDARCLPDGEHPLGHVNSIYFDSHDLHSLGEKLDGDNLKMKIRARWYGCPEESTDSEIPVFIEIKCRLGSARDKVRSRVSAPGRWLGRTPLDDPSFPAFLYHHAAALGYPIPRHWVPSVCISYDRRRYRCPLTDARVSIDWGIRADRFNPTLFPFVAPARLPETVCEFKSPGGEPPPWAESLHRAGFRLRSFSKYGECLARILQGAPPR